MKKKISFYAGNSLVYAAILGGTFYANPYAMNLTRFTIPVLAIFATLMLCASKKPTGHMPQVLNAFIDLGQVLLLAAFGHFVLAGFKLWELCCNVWIAEKMIRRGA